VLERWLGMSQTLKRARDVLGREPDRRDLQAAEEWWTDVSPVEASLIAEARYDDGADSAEIDQYQREFPSPKFAWSLLHSY
jgi:hypothetical protein